MTSWILLLLAAIPSIILHEIAHGAVANHFGDPTAKNAGRLTLNPLKHIDPFGTVILPVVMALSGLPAFGYAKPVPVSTNRLRRPRNQSVLVSLAGPFVNVILVVLAWAVCRVLLHSSFVNGQLFSFFVELGIVNIILTVFNMLPIPPLDGSAVVERLVPARHLRGYFTLRSRMMPFAIFILLGIFFIGGQNSLGNRVENDLIRWWLNLIMI